MTVGVAYKFWDNKRSGRERGAGLRLGHFLVALVLSGRLRSAVSIEMCVAKTAQAMMRRPRSCCAGRERWPSRICE